MIFLLTYQSQCSTFMLFSTPSPTPSICPLLILVPSPLILILHHYIKILHFLPLSIPPTPIAPLFGSTYNFSTYNDWLATTGLSWSSHILISILHFHLIFNTSTHSLYLLTSYTSPFPLMFILHHYINPPLPSLIHPPPAQLPLYLTLPAISLPIMTGLQLLVYHLDLPTHNPPLSPCFQHLHPLPLFVHFLYFPPPPWFLFSTTISILHFPPLFIPPLFGPLFDSPCNSSTYWLAFQKYPLE